MVDANCTLRRTGLALAWAAVAMATSAYGGEFFERGGAALDGYDPVAYFTEKKAVAGVKSFSAEYKGSEFHFATAANRDKFRAAPESFAPQYGGFCAFGTAGGYKAKIDPTVFTVADGKLYLNYNAKVQSEWGKDVPGYVIKADKQWPTVSKLTKVIE